jgi:hypothetical protein
MIVVAVIQSCEIFKMPSVEQAVAAPHLEKAACVSSDEQFTDYCDKVEIPRFFNSFSRISLVIG